MKLLLSALIFLSAMQAQASAWLQNEDQGEVITNLRYQNGEFADQYELNPYIEWGVSETVSVGGSLTYRQSVATDPISQDFTLGFGELFAKKLLYKGDFSVISAQLAAGTTADTINVQSSDFNYSANPTTEARIMWGVSSDKHHWGSVFLNSEAAIRTFYGKKGMEWRGEETIGYKPSTKNNHLILGQFFWTKNWNEDLGPQDYDSLSFQASWVIPVSSHWRVQVGESFTLGGRHVDYVPVYLLSAWYQW